LLQKNLPYLASVASTAPYVGLFGTVLGILEAFRRIAATGQTGPAVVSGSISEALITTALGLGVAIPAAIGYNLLLARVNEFSLIVENHSLEIADALGDQAPSVGAVDAEVRP
jgi:biopolymer transport protein ExbB/TolQ